MTTEDVIEGLEKLTFEFEFSYNLSGAVLALFGVAKIYELDNQPIKMAETLMKITKVLIQDKRFDEAAEILKNVVDDLAGVSDLHDIYLEAQYYAVLSVLADNLDWKFACDLLGNENNDLLQAILIAVKTKDVDLLTKTMVASEKVLNKQLDAALFYHIKCSLEEVIAIDNQ